MDFCFRYQLYWVLPSFYVRGRSTKRLIIFQLAFLHFYLPHYSPSHLHYLHYYSFVALRVVEPRFQAFKLSKTKMNPVKSSSVTSKKKSL